MGIEVLAPDIDASQLDFSLEQLPVGAPPPAGRDQRMAYAFPVPERAAIRYGLAAIKNVGEGPVQAILEARQDVGPFRGLEDFCQRVDLRKVGKKALECLIKVGALDTLGERAQLLEALDQMIGVSRSHHEAEAVGQLSMFDLLGGAGLATSAVALRLPEVKPLTPRERLAYEKELLGVYVSAHPLQQMAVDLSGVITCFCGELDESYAGKQVVLAGNVARVNPITTKKGERMAFVTLEDLQGQCDLTVFPKTWETTKDLLQVDKVVLVRGKAELRGEKVNVVCDEIKDYVMRFVAADEDGLRVVSYSQPLFADANGLHKSVAAFKLPTIAESREDLAYGEDLYGAGDDDSGESPFASEEPEWLREAPTVWKGERDERRERAETRERTETGGRTEEPGALENITHRPPIAAASPRELCITIQRTADLERDKRLLTWVYDLLAGQPGPDRFCILLRRNGSVTRLDFPNHSTTISPALQEQLVRRLGEGNVEMRELLP